MTLHAQREGLQTLQQDEGVEGRDGGARVAQNDGADAGDKGGWTRYVGKDGAVLGGVGTGQRGELVRVLRPGEGAAVDDDSAEA